MFRGFFRPEGGVAMLEGLSRLLWGWHVVILILGAGAWFTWESGFFQIRAAGRWLGAALSCAGEGKKAGGLSRLQALATGLAGSLGTGGERYACRRYDAAWRVGGRSIGERRASW